MTVSARESGDRFARVFDILELLVSHPHGMTLTDVSRRLGLPTRSTHNLLQRMVATDVVVVGTGLQYSIGPRAVRLSIRVVDGLEMRAIARRHLQELARRTGEDVYLAVRMGRRVVYVERLPGTRAVSVDIRLGQSLFLHATSVGKLFAAHHPVLHRRLMAEPRPDLTKYTIVESDQLEQELATIREVGYVVSREEAILGIVGLAVPVYDADHTLVAGIHVSALQAQLTLEHERDVLDAARDSAEAISRELGRLQPTVVA